MHSQLHDVEPGTFHFQYSSVVTSINLEDTRESFPGTGSF